MGEKLEPEGAAEFTAAKNKLDRGDLPNNVNESGVPMYGIYPDGAGDHPMFGGYNTVSESAKQAEEDAIPDELIQRGFTKRVGPNLVMDEHGNLDKISPFGPPFYL